MQTSKSTLTHIANDVHFAQRDASARKAKKDSVIKRNRNVYRRLHAFSGDYSPEVLEVLCPIEDNQPDPVVPEEVLTNDDLMSCFVAVDLQRCRDMGLNFKRQLKHIKSSLSCWMRRLLNFRAEILKNPETMPLTWLRSRASRRPRSSSHPTRCTCAL